MPVFFIPVCVVCISYEINYNIMILRDFIFQNSIFLTACDAFNMLMFERKFRNMTRIIAFANQKGGVGKTTTAINIGASLAATKRRVLLVDLDPQGNAGTGLGFVRAAHRQSVYGPIMGTASAADNILTTAVPNMHIMPSTTALSGAEVELLDIDGREYRLRDALAPIADYYDYILLDCPPALGYLTLNAMTTADAVIIPMQCEFYALEGLQHLTTNIAAIKKNTDKSFIVFFIEIIPIFTRIILIFLNYSISLPFIFFNTKLKFS